MYNTFQEMLRKEEHVVAIERQCDVFGAQPNLTADMRLMLIDWLCQVSSDYCLKRETFHRAVLMVDRYFSACNFVHEVCDFQLIGITCLHIAAKLEEIYPPYIKSFAESTDNSVTVDDINATELKICTALKWNFDNTQTYVLWTHWFMQRWDDYVDNSLSYLKEQFHLKFFEGGRPSFVKYFTMMNFIDLIAMSYEAKQYPPRVIVASVMYLFIGGKEIMCAFPLEYAQMSQEFEHGLPINCPGNQTRLPEGILFYN